MLIGMDLLRLPELPRAIGTSPWDGACEGWSIGWLNTNQIRSNQSKTSSWAHHFSNSTNSGPYFTWIVCLLLFVFNSCCWWLFLLLLLPLLVSLAWYWCSHQGLGWLRPLAGSCFGRQNRFWTGSFWWSVLEAGSCSGEPMPRVLPCSGPRWIGLSFSIVATQVRSQSQVLCFPEGAMMISADSSSWKLFVWRSKYQCLGFTKSTLVWLRVLDYEPHQLSQSTLTMTNHHKPILTVVKSSSSWSTIYEPPSTINKHQNIAALLIKH